jgi:hypothetical protein
MQDGKSILVYMVMKTRKKSAVKDQYYHLWIAAAKDQVFFGSVTDKAFFIALFQDYLSPRANLGQWSRRHQGYAQELDLIVYSLTDFGVNLLLCTSDTEAIEDFGQALLSHYATYLSQQTNWEKLPFDTIFTYDHLADEHEALAISRDIHLLHRNWRSDRYSSIGFYIEDRRGDWMQPWRLTNLFHNDAEWYLNFMQDDSGTVPAENFEFEFIET